MTIDDKTRTELEAAVFRRLVEHLRAPNDVQNIDLMNLAGFCRNCLSNWLKEEADAKGTAMSKDESREAVYGMPYETWKSSFQGRASPEHPRPECVSSKEERGCPGHLARRCASRFCPGMTTSFSPVGALWTNAMVP